MLVEEVLSGLNLGPGPVDTPMPRPEIVFHRGDGTDIFLGFSTSPMKDADGIVIGNVVIFQDLTPVKQMEERIRTVWRESESLPRDLLTRFETLWPPSPGPPRCFARRPTCR